MKSVRAAALRLILPLEARGVTVDFLGTDDFFDTDAFEEDFVLFDEVLFDEDDRELELCDPLPFEASKLIGSSRAAIRTKHVRRMARDYSPRESEPLSSTFPETPRQAAPVKQL